MPLTPAPVDIEVATAIRASPEQVWPWLVDWEQLDRWQLEASGFRVLGNQREGVGVRAEATVHIAGITTRDTVVVTRWEPPNWLEIRHRGWVAGSGLMHCRGTGDGCYLWWRERLIPPWGWFGAAGLHSLKPVMTRVFRRDLGVLKRLIEGP
ncbi:MAG TPA: SRPBCC family protein [Actinomycetota bacterium]|nr:SRPBCC family protein [Actinomycetota bacterium]